VSGQQSFIIDRGEQVHTLESRQGVARSGRRRRLPARRSTSPYDEEEAFDLETEGEVETEETEGLVEDARRQRRSRWRRRKATHTAASGAGAGRGRSGEPREGGAPREDNGRPREENDALRVVAEVMESSVAGDDGESDEDEGDDAPGVVRGDQPANGERRPRRRGRRWRNVVRRGNGPDRRSRRIDRR